MSTANVHTKRLTAEEFCAFVHQPKNRNKWFELVRGEVIELPPPQKPHGFVTVNIGRILGNYTFKIGRYYVLGNDSGVILERDPDMVRGPDVAVYADAEHYEDLHPIYGETPPLLAIEVLSPNDKAHRVMAKITDYLRNGVAVVWVADPELRSVTVYTKDSGPQVFEGKQILTGGNILPGLKCKVADFFRLPGDKPPRVRKSKS
jgi:Uma2 family endonuclease